MSLNSKKQPFILFLTEERKKGKEKERSWWKEKDSVFCI